MGYRGPYFRCRIYYGPVANNLLQFQFSNARLSTSPRSKSAAEFGYPGTPRVSPANGSKNALCGQSNIAIPMSVLHAYDATNLANELYDSNQLQSARSVGDGSHFGTPLVVNGQVYVGTTNNVTVFGCFT